MWLRKMLVVKVPLAAKAPVKFLIVIMLPPRLAYSLQLPSYWCSVHLAHTRSS